MMEQEIDVVLDMSDRFFKIAIAVVAILALGGLAFMYYQFSNVPQNAPHEISVTGQGKAFVKPDIAQVSFGVTTEAPKSQDAVNKNNEIMNKVIAAIKNVGVEDKDIQTTSYNLTPMYDYPKIYSPVTGSDSSIAMPPSYGGGGRVFKGYQLTQQISVKIRDFSKISDVLDKATSSGATNVGDLQFTIDNPEKIQSEARAMAIAKAKEKLQDIVGQSGLKVGKLVNISEGYYNYPQPMYAQGSALNKDSASVAPEIQAGQQEVDSTITLTYQVR